MPSPTWTRPQQPPLPSLRLPLLQLLRGTILSGQHTVQANTAGHWCPQVAKQDLAAAPGQLQDVIRQCRHRGVAHVVQVKHVPQVLHDLVLGYRAGMRLGPRPLTTTDGLQIPQSPPRASLDPWARLPVEGAAQDLCRYPTGPFLGSRPRPSLHTWHFPGLQSPGPQQAGPRWWQWPQHSLLTLKKAQTSASWGLGPRKPKAKMGLTCSDTE